MPRLRLVVLDHDETVVENTIDFYEAYCEAFKAHGSSCISYDEFYSLLRSNELSKRIPREITQSDFWITFRKLYKSRHSYPRRGLIEFLVAMRNLGVKVTIVSGRESHPADIQNELRRHGVDEYIDDVYTLHNLYTMGLSEDFLFDKSQLINYVKRKHGVYGNDVFVCIGDYITDYLSCSKTGGLFIGINSLAERNHELKKHGVKYTAKDFYEVLFLLSELGLL